MKLIREYVEKDKLILVEEEGEKKGCHSEKNYYIKGPFMVADTRNANERSYGRNVLKNAVEKYQKLIKEKRSIGECDHPADATVNLKNAAILITELGFKSENDNNVYGVAKVLSPEYFPMAKIIVGLLKEGIMCGVSSRGVGSLNNGIVGNDFELISVDAVAVPSGPGCFVEGVLEGKEFTIEGNQIVECAVKNLRKEVDRKYDSKRNLEYLTNFLNDIKVKG